MPSLIPGYENDIFISYRQNDNRPSAGSEGWVNEFVRALQEELASTIKGPVSVYFDTNPHDGLLETNDVNKSLENKLRCVIFIPILSQTYCDPKSFAWIHEFCAFNKMSREDLLGKDVKLANGNVTSRILPVKIHDLDRDDISAIEQEIGGGLRSVEFIYKEPGVNRPLIPSDRKIDNQHKTDYRNQVNKITNAIKDVLTALKFPGKRALNPGETQSASLGNETVREPIQAERSIAVLPFANLSKDPSQEYFADGITENILSQLHSLKQFRVISRTSVMRYKKTTLSIKEIAHELDVKYIVEGSAQSHKDKVRIGIQLVNAVEDQTLWSKVFMEKMDDIFEVQSSVAEAVARELQTSLIPQPKEITGNLEAYDHFLKGRHAFNQWSMEGYRIASDCFRKAITLDPEFKAAYSFLASSYSARMSWNGDLAPDEALRNIEPPLGEAWKRGPSDNDYLTKAFVEFFVHKNFEAADAHLDSAQQMNPNNAMVLYTRSYVLDMMGRFEEALNLVDQARRIDPLTVASFNYYAISRYFVKQYDEAIEALQEGLRLFPAVIRFHDLNARILLTVGRFQEARDAVLTSFRNFKTRPPSMVAWLAAAQGKLSEKAKAQELIDELAGRSLAGEKGVNIYLVYASTALGDESGARKWLEMARKTNDIDLVWWNVDPLLMKFRDGVSGSMPAPDIEGAERHIAELLEKKMPSLDYHNLAHIRNVLQATQVIAQAEKCGDEEKGLLRVAALLHDAGFIYSAKDHEERGAEMAREILPRFGFDPGRVETICGMILATRLPQSPVTLLEKILCDADLDYLGQDDFIEVGTRLFQEMRSSGVVKTEGEWDQRQRDFLTAHRYHTEFSRTHRERKKQEWLGELLQGDARR